MCNVLAVILRANYGSPVDSAQDMLDRNITLLLMPGAEMWRQWFESHAVPEYRELSKDMIIAESYEEYFDLMKHAIMEDNKHAIMIGYLTPWMVLVIHN